MTGRGVEISSQLALPQSEAIWHGATLQELAQGYESATPFLRKNFAPGHDVLQFVRFDQSNSTIGYGRVNVLPSLIPVYYAGQHGLVIPSGVDSIQACLDLASIVALRQTDGGIAVFESANFNQPAKAPPGSFMNLEANVLVDNHGQVHGEVTIFNSLGVEMARTTELRGKVEELTDPAIDSAYKPEVIKIPEGFTPARKLLLPIYHPQRHVLHYIDIANESEGTGLVVVGKDGNTDYFAKRHRSHRLPEIKLVHAAMQTVSLVALQDQIPKRFALPFYSRGNFEPVPGVDMGEFVLVETKITRRTSTQVDAESNLLNPKGEVFARITEIHGSLVPASAMNRILSAGYKFELKETLESINSD